VIIIVRIRVMINRRGREVIVVMMSVTGRMYMLYF